MDTLTGLAALLAGVVAVSLEKPPLNKLWAFVPRSFKFAVVLLASFGIGFGVRYLLCQVAACDVAVQGQLNAVVDSLAALMASQWAYSISGYYD